jgi:hypothetical protein
VEEGLTHVTDERWIVIPNWARFQHYQTRKGEQVQRPDWLKTYVRLLHDDAYLKLTLHQRGVLHGLWLEYAAAGRQLPDSTATVSRRLGERVTRGTLDALNHAGFIAYCSRPDLDGVYTESSPEQSREEISKERLGKGSSANGLPTDLKGETESSFALIALLAEVNAPDAEKARLRSYVEGLKLQPFALHTARDELAQAKTNGKKIGKQCGYVRRILERYANEEPDLEEPEPSLTEEPKAAA